MSHDRPILLFDDDCGVCTDAARWVAERDAVELVGFSDVSDDVVERLPAEWRSCAHLITDDSVYSCGEAMERAFLLTDHWGTRPVGVARRLPGYARIREVGYRIFASNRPAVARLRRE